MIIQVVCCAITGCILHIEVQEGKDAMQAKKYSSELGATAGCSARLIRNTRYCGRKHDSRTKAKKDKKAEIVYGDSWFGSKVSLSSLFFLFSFSNYS